MIIDVALPLPITKAFSYSLPPGIADCVRPFSRVKVPFNKGSLVGFVLALRDGDGDGKLKALGDLLDPLPLIDSKCLGLCEWAARYYAAPLGLALKHALPAFIKTDRYCLVKALDPSVSHLDNMVLHRAYGAVGKENVLDYLNHSLISLADVFAGFSLEPLDRPARSDGPPPLVHIGGMRDRLQLYLSLISEQIGLGRNVLALLPDRYGAGDCFHRAFSAAFPGSVFWFTSSMTEKKRAETYFRSRGAKGALFLGNRSSVFLPISDLGLVLVDRPEEDEYRNEEEFRFSATRLAMKKAEIEGVPLVLGSVSPPIEIVREVAEDRIAVDNGKLDRSPRLSYMKDEKGRGTQSSLPALLVERIAEIVDRGRNVVVHAHRRSYAAGLRCSACGRALVCLHCGSFSMSYDREADFLTCNACRSRFTYQETCPTCHSPYIRYSVVGAEYLESALQEALPGRAVLRVTGEAGSRPKKPLSKDVQGINGAIIVGTNVLSKLYDVKAETLILYRWDDMLRTAGYRAREKMFQLLSNLLDAMRPEEILAYTQGDDGLDLSLYLDPQRFWADELERRMITDFPPYKRFFLINVLRGNARAAEKALKTIETVLGGQDLDEQVMGPIQVKGQYGWRIVLKGDEDTLSPLLMSLYQLPGVHIEADPFYF
jgi:primosomal protein N' (replication factor Y) (superfamily II helicase)